MDIKQLKFLIALDETRHFGQAAARCHITQPTLSHHMKVPRECGLLLTRTEGKWCYYRLNCAAFKKFRTFISSLCCVDNKKCRCQ